MKENLKIPAALAAVGVGFVSMTPAGLCGPRDFCGAESVHQPHAHEREPAPVQTSAIKDIAAFTLTLRGSGYGMRT